MNYLGTFDGESTPGQLKNHGDIMEYHEELPQTYSKP